MVAGGVYSDYWCGDQTIWSELNHTINPLLAKAQHGKCFKCKSDDSEVPRRGLSTRRSRGRRVDTSVINVFFCLFFFTRFNSQRKRKEIKRSDPTS